MSISFSKLAAPQAAIVIASTIGRISAITALAGMIFAGNSKLIEKIISVIASVNGIPIIAIFVAVAIVIAIDHMLIMLIYKIINQRFDGPYSDEHEILPIVEAAKLASTP